MIPIYLETSPEGVGYGFDEFRERFVEICEEHHATGRALAFAMILYDFRVPEMAKVLRDQDYWRALHHVSGTHLTVFSVHFERPASPPPVKEARFMIPVSASGDPGLKAQLILRSYFNLEGRLRLPAVLFFQVHKGEVVDYHLWEMHVSGVEETFCALREAISLAVDSVAKVTDENKGNSHEIFNLMSQRLREGERLVKIRQGVKKLKTAGEAASLVTMLV